MYRSPPYTSASGRLPSQSAELVLDVPEVVMWWVPGGRYVHHQYLATIGGPVLREQLLLGVELLRRHRATKWLSDNRLTGPHPDADVEWINREWLPKAVAAGWTSWALVSPAMFDGKQNMRHFISAFSRFGVMVQVFAELDEARRWLVQQP